MSKKIYTATFFIAVLILLTSISLTQNTKADSGPHSIKGVLYINDEIAPENILIKLVFADGTEATTTYVYDSYGDCTNYNLAFWGYEEETGEFVVEYNNEEIEPDDNKTIYIVTGAIAYVIDLHITASTPENNHPDKPTNPQPANNSDNIILNPQLSVDVSDIDGDTMNVSFYNATDDSFIDSINNVISGDTATVTWSDLSYNHTYSWYARANDSEFETKSDTWNFTTKTEENNPPTVEIITPEDGALYICNKMFLPGFFRMPLIIGDITIEVNATDDEGIEKVEFYINDDLKGNDTSEPYTYNWTKDRIRLIHRFDLKVIAYDNEDKTAEDTITVRKFL